MASSGLPDFERPPVVETVLGVQFDPLLELENAHLGLFWKKLGSDWPTANDAAFLDSQFERFGDDRIFRPLGIKFGISQIPPLRIQIKNKDDNRMIQLQNQRFHFNWLGKDEAEYPRFNSVKPEFVHAFHELEQFVDQESLGKFRPNQWEVTYVNQIPKGELWETPEDWPGIFNFFGSFSSDHNLISAESFLGEWHYVIEPQQGRLHINLKHSKNSDGELLLLNFTARGSIGKENGVENYSDGLDLGRNTIVTAFKDLTTQKAHNYWGLIDDKSS